MERIAQTNLQLYNQLQSQGRSPEELRIVHLAYEFLTTIYPGYYQADGKPFVAHTVGVASILGHLSLPVEFIVAGLLHNIYGNGDFGDGLSNVVTAARRRIVRREVGERIEILIDRFRKYRIRPKSIQHVTNRLDELNQTDQMLLVIDLADYLEKYVDSGVCYWGNGRSVVDVGTEHGEQLIAIAMRLGYPKLVTMLDEAFEHVRAAEIPDFLRPSDGRKFLELIVPRSCRRRLGPVVRGKLRKQWQLLRRMPPFLRSLHPVFLASVRRRHD